MVIFHSKHSQISTTHIYLSLTGLQGAWGSGFTSAPWGFHPETSGSPRAWSSHKDGGQTTHQGQSGTYVKNLRLHHTHDHSSGQNKLQPQAQPQQKAVPSLEGAESESLLSDKYTLLWKGGGHSNSKLKFFLFWELEEDWLGPTILHALAVGSLLIWTKLGIF